MPVLGSLEDLSRRRACEILKEVCQSLQSLLTLGASGSYVLEYAKRVLRPYYVNSLPGTIRSRMIDETWNHLYYDSINSAGLIQTPLYLLTILLGPDVKKLRIRLCCYYGCSHQADLFKLLSSEGIGMESLELERTAILRLDSNLLRGALINMRNLRSLTMKNIADDSILASIGRACPNLVVLDVACSQQVTDRGLQHLLVKYRLTPKKESIKIAERATETPNSKTLHSSGAGGGRRRRRKTTWSRIKALLQKLEMKDDKKEGKEEYLLDMKETRNPICDSLRFLNITKTRVTINGVLMLLSQAANLESLADYYPISSVTEINDRTVDRGVARVFRLREAYDSDTTFKRLQSLADACPRLEKLSIFHPRHPVIALRAFSSLTSLTLDAIPSESLDWVESLNDYLRTNGSNLQQLNLRAKKSNNNHNSPLEFDLSKVFLNCPNLVSLTKEGSHVVWKNVNEPMEPLKRLKIIQLGNSVSANAIVKIFTLAPELTSLHAKSCNELTDRHFEFLFKNPEHEASTLIGPNFQTNSENCIAKNLTCFYIDEANQLTTKAVTKLLQSCNYLERIGNLDNWDLHCYEIELITEMAVKQNIHFKCSSVHHWYLNIRQSFERQLQKKCICDF